jgi:nucleoside phosphorylase
MHHKNHFLTIISQGDIRKTIDELLTATQQNGQVSLYNNIILLSGRFNYNEGEKHRGTISTTDYSLERNRIKETLIHLLDEYKGGENEVVVEPRKVSTPIDKFVPLQLQQPMKVYLQEKHFDQIQPLIKRGLVLLVTATATESKALHQQMQPLPNETGLIEVKKNNATYYIGKFGNFAVVNVECGTMGTGSSMGSIVTTTNAINDFNPKFVLMVGIAFGINPEKQNIGDVLVSNALIPYEIQRLGKHEDIWRGTKPEAHNSLRNNFKNIKDWEYTLPNGEVAQLDVCDVLTGEKLVDNIDFRNELTKTFPTALGGEMEGAGLYAACQDKNIPWILVKAICDFADGEKKNGKKEKQELAITVALDACLQVFNKKFVFEDLGVTVYDGTSDYLFK